MKTLYLDCFSGISGDMCLAALLDLGVVSPDEFVEAMKALDLDEYELSIDKTAKNSIAATDVRVIVKEHTHTHDHDHGHDRNHNHAHDHSHEHHHTHERNLANITDIINHSRITDRAKAMALKIFACIAAAEAKVHGTDIEHVHFHEVGAVDSIVDIVGVAVLIDMLGVERIVCSYISDGHGFVECRHGLIPIPVPATAQILSGCAAVVRQLDIESELVTPTGAAIVASLCDSFGAMPYMANALIGYGAGKKDFAFPNLLRVYLDETEEIGDFAEVVETNIDDMTAEAAGYVMERLFDAGALDVWFTPIHMKKNRPGYTVSVLCAQSDAYTFETILLRHTTTLGVRRYSTVRRMLQREAVSVDTEYGTVDIKLAHGMGICKLAPEYESVRAAALAKNVSFNDVYAAAIRAAECTKVLD